MCCQSGFLGTAGHFSITLLSGHPQKKSGRISCSITLLSNKACLFLCEFRFQWEVILTDSLC